MLREETKNGRTKSPKLKAKAGEARALVALELAVEYLDQAKLHEEAMLRGTEALHSMFACLSAAAWDKDVFRAAFQRFLLFWESLETYFLEDKIFKVKPKVHLLFELARGEVNPSKTWTYRDESYGQTLALLFHAWCLLPSSQKIPGSEQSAAMVNGKCAQSDVDLDFYFPDF